ncbi:entry exclusion protein TrbK [Rhizobium sp. G187]|uniref:entry exclusion protein TrbK n=1 Tax=Rhizobium sp. G187 TaxID=3451352 RepID=UPI003EE67DF3
MNIRLKLVTILIVVAALSSAATAVIIKFSPKSTMPEMSEEQRSTRQKFFGTNGKLQPIEKGQEMRPRW